MNYQFIYEYIPVRYIGVSAEQQNARNTVYSFKDGNCPRHVMETFLSRIKSIVNGLQGETVVCFIPASTKAKSVARYSSLASFLSRSLSGQVSVALDAIVLTQDHEAGHLNGSLPDPSQYFSFNSSRFSGKNVILIDDVITRGRSFNDTGSKMLVRGARTVTGLFLAKTIHPDLPIREGKAPRWYEEELMDEICGIDEEELMAEVLYDDEIDPSEFYDEIGYDDFCPEDFM